MQTPPSSAHFLLGALRAVAAAVVMLPGLALAQKPFPGEVQQALDMPCAPQCTICHMDNNGGFGTLRPGPIDPATGMAKPGLAPTLQGLGLSLGNPDSVAPALEAAEGVGTDVDGDGVGDVQELRDGTDPNDPTNAVDLCVGPVYGCVHVAREGRVDGVAGAASAAVLLFGLAAVRRRRRR